MKFIAKDGSIHDTLFGSMTSSVSTKVDNFIKDKLPGYKESVERKSIEEDIDDVDDFFDDEDDLLYDESSTPIDDFSKMMNPPEDPIEEENVEVQSDEEDMSEAIEDVTSKTHIEIDYMRGKLYLKKDDTGETLQEAEIDPRLLSAITESQVSKILYPNFKIPDEINSSVKVSDMKVENHKSTTNTLAASGSVEDSQSITDETIENLSGNK